MRVDCSCEMQNENAVGVSRFGLLVARVNGARKRSHITFGFSLSLAYARDTRNRARRARFDGSLVGVARVLKRVRAL